VIPAKLLEYRTFDVGAAHANGAPSGLNARMTDDLDAATAVRNQRSY
jgi:hypothetical protein